MSTREPRERKQPSKLSYDDEVETGKEVPQGSGTALGEIDALKSNFGNTKEHVDAVKALHMLVFKSKGKAGQQRKKLKTFRGIVYGEDQELDRSRYVERACKYKKSEINDMLAFLELDRTPSSFEDGEASKENMANRLVDFLENPTASKKRKGKDKDGGKKPSGGAAAKKPKLSPLEETLLTAIHKKEDSVEDYIDGKLPANAKAYLDALAAPDEDEDEAEDDAAAEKEEEEEEPPAAEEPPKKKPAAAKKKPGRKPKAAAAAKKADEDEEEADKDQADKDEADKDDDDDEAAAEDAPEDKKEDDDDDDEEPDKDDDKDADE